MLENFQLFNESGFTGNYSSLIKYKHCIEFYQVTGIGVSSIDFLWSNEHQRDDC